MMQDDLMLQIQTRTLIHHHQNVSCQVSLTPKSHHRPQTQMMCCASFKYVSCHRLWLSRIIYCCLSWPFFHRRCVSFVTIFSNATILIIGWKKNCVYLFLVYLFNDSRLAIVVDQSAMQGIHIIPPRNHISIDSKLFLICSFTFQDLISYSTIKLT